MIQVIIVAIIFSLAVWFLVKKIVREVSGSGHNCPNCAVAEVVKKKNH